MHLLSSVPVQRNCPWRIRTVGTAAGPHGEDWHYHRYRLGRLWQTAKGKKRKAVGNVEVVGGETQIDGRQIAAVSDVIRASCEI